MEYYDSASRGEKGHHVIDATWMDLGSGAERSKPDSGRVTLVTLLTHGVSEMPQTHKIENETVVKEVRGKKIGRGEVRGYKVTDA